MLSLVVALILSVSVTIAPVWAAPASGGFGTVVSAEHARVGMAAASVGTTIFAGDSLDTETQGTLQVRAGAARFLLSSASKVIWGADAAQPSATLTAGTAVFSTANAKAFALHVATATIRPSSDEPTIGSVTVLSPKELIVRCSRGALTVAVEDDVRVVSEGSAYRIVLDPTPDAANAAWGQNGPQRAGRSRFIWFAIAFAAIATGLGIHYALESPDRP
jgi:hypothetical protein